MQGPQCRPAAESTTAAPAGPCCDIAEHKDRQGIIFSTEV